MSQLLTKFQPKMTEIYQSIVIPKLDYDQVESSDNMNSEAPTEQESQNNLIIPSEQLLQSALLLAYPMWRQSEAEESGRCNQESSSVLQSP